MKEKTIWYEFNDIFYGHKCRNGLSGSDPNKYSFDKRNHRYFIERINDNLYYLYIRNNKTLKSEKYEFDNLDRLKDKIEEEITKCK